jgi:hypothetical protein
LQQGSKKARQEEVGYASSSVGELASQPTNQPASQPAEGLFCTSALQHCCFFGWQTVCVLLCVCARARALCLFLPTRLS